MRMLEDGPSDVATLLHRGRSRIIILKGVQFDKATIHCMESGAYPKEILKYIHR